MTAVRSYRLAWPREVSPAQVTAAMRMLATTADTPLILDSIGRAGRVEHWLHVVEGRSGAVVNQLRSAIPGVAIEHGEPNELPEFGLAIDLRLSTRRRALRIDNQADVARTVIEALANVGRDEAILLRWRLTDGIFQMPVPSRLQLHDESWAAAIVKAPFGAAPQPDSELIGAMRDKQREAGWRITGQLAVQAASASRRQQLANAVMGALRTAQAPGVALQGRSIRVGQVARPPRHGKLRLNAVELSGVSGWPIGDTSSAPVSRVGSRRLPASSAIPKEGRVIGESTWPGSARPLAMSPDDALRHLHLLGPTGTGKSTLMLNLIEQDMGAGRGLVVVDPKGDLVTDVLARVPDERLGDVVVIDASGGENVVGINPLAGGNGLAPEVAADQLLEVFHGLYASSWGPRTNDILGAALLTLARVGGQTLSSVPPLLTDAGFRRRIVGRLDDPLGLSPFWDEFEALSDAERTTAIAPVLRRLRPFVMRANLRRIVGQVSPSFNFRDVFTKRRIVLIDLAKGRIGGEAAQLLGALVLTQLWQAAQSRAAIPKERRHPVVAYLDEFQDYLALPVSLEDALAQARGLGLGFVLAHQHLKQLPPSVRSAVLSNARSRACFQLSAEDAREFARDGGQVEADDFSSLDAFHFYAQLAAGNHVQPWCSGRGRPATEARANPADVRSGSLHRFGTPVAEVDAAAEQLAERPSQSLGRRRMEHGS